VEKLPKSREAAMVRKPPRDKLFIRKTLNPLTFHISAQHLRAWIVARDLIFKDFIKELEDLGICTSSKKFVTLGAGTEHSSGQILCVEIDGEKL
jgi:hypothetical protein